MRYSFTVNGLTVDAEYHEQDVAHVLLPLVKRWQALQKEKDRRIFVFLAAPPGCGKTTLSLFLEYLAEREGIPVQAIGMDGFHYSNSYLNTHQQMEDGVLRSLMERKGSSDTFDVVGLKQKILEGREKDNLWPCYSRKIHDVIPDQIRAEKAIILIEGNYLLLNEGRWKDLIEYCDDSIFMYAKEAELKDRLIARKVAGGKTRKEAEEFYESSDRKNIMQVLHHHHDAQSYLLMKGSRLQKGE